MAAALVQQLRDVVLGDGSIEDELAAVDAGKAAYPADRRALAAVQFYLQQILYTCSVYASSVGTHRYASLARRLDQWSMRTGQPVV